MGATIPKERLEQMSKSVMAFSSDGNDSYKVSVTTGGHTQDTKFKLGEAFDHDTMDGRHIKARYAFAFSCILFK
ncbi:unnamed protein product [Dibothriocephalus latus]|uniref:Uncharacterized protein n=1 Tax=Dibothriocephalus latus TaxID=60516 RepID=A0A3P7NML1_DIBLA|nr:unnamed protein product [Dibothriocephalus latus]